MVKSQIIMKRVLFWTLLSLYAGMVAAVIISLAIGKYEFADVKHVGTSSLIGLFVTLLPVFIWRVFRIQISLSIMLFAGFMVLLNTLGEVLNLYYRFQNFDIFLHTVGGYGFAFIVFGAFYSVRSPRGKAQTAIYLLGAIAISIAINTIWELLEYSVDRVLGTNMLKTIPENELFNGGTTRETLVGTDEQIADFYRHPTGYMYAITDTISDLICGAAGAIIFCAEYLLVGVRHPRRYKETFIKILPPDKMVG